MLSPSLERATAAATPMAILGITCGSQLKILYLSIKRVDLTSNNVSWTLPTAWMTNLDNAPPVLQYTMLFSWHFSVNWSRVLLHSAEVNRVSYSWGAGVEEVSQNRCVSELCQLLLTSAQPPSSPSNCFITSQPAPYLSPTTPQRTPLNNPVLWCTATLISLST